VKLHDELDRLANTADRYPDPDRLIRLARRHRTRRLVAVPVAAVLAIAVVAAVPVWWSAHRRAELARQGRTTITLTVDPATATAPDALARQRLASILTQRSRALGLHDPDIHVGDDGSAVVSVAGRPDDYVVSGLVAPGELRVRRVLGSTADRPADTPSPPPGGPASTPAPSLDQVAAKLGTAYQLAQGITDPDAGGADAVRRLAAFGTLSPAEVAALPPTMQYAVPTIGCAQLDGRAYLPGGPGDQPVVGCGTTDGQTTKYLLGPSSLSQADIADATTVNDPGAGWTVDVRFNAAGQSRFTALTAAVYGDGSTDPGVRRIAFTVDGRVVSAPSIGSVITGDALLGGQQDAEQNLILAARLRYGPLPVALRITAIDRSPYAVPTA
jgi:hypothetical protein